MGLQSYFIAAWNHPTEYISARPLFQLEVFFFIQFSQRDFEIVFVKEL